MFTIDDLSTFCKKKGFVYPGSELYGGLSGFFDYVHLGVELKNNIKQQWWKTFVQSRSDVVGIDGSIIANPKVWKASGHVDCFTDLLVEDTKTKERYRADHLVHDKLKISVDGLSAEDLWKLIEQNNLKSPKGNPLTPPKKFNLMFKTNVGPLENENSIAYLRPETAQLIFADFRLVTEHARLKVPFGIAQIGKAFRNEISPRDFMFRSREFELMEIEFFTHSERVDECLYFDEVKDIEVNFLSRQDQSKNQHHKPIKISKIKASKWQLYWLGIQYKWFLSLGVKPANLRVREHLKDELAHYATACFDIDYNFPFGWKEIQGNAARGNFDLKQHQEHSKQSMELFDEETKQKFLPIVASEPSQGVDRAFLTFMFDAYNYDEKRGNVVLKLHPKLAPVKAAVFPLVSNKEEITSKAKEVYNQLKHSFTTQYDAGGSIGRRYARADEQGTPYCITIDFDTLNDNTVTVRDRDTTEQKRIKISDVADVILRSVVWFL